MNELINNCEIYIMIILANVFVCLLLQNILSQLLSYIYPSLHKNLFCSDRKYLVEISHKLKLLSVKYTLTPTRYVLSTYGEEGPVSPCQLLLIN